MRRLTSRNRWVKTNHMPGVTRQMLVRLQPALLFAALLSQTACSNAKDPPRILTPVRVAVVQVAETGSELRYSANIEPNAQVDLVFKSGGYVERVLQVRGPGGGFRNVDTGDWVTRGTVLAVVRQQDYRDKLEQAGAQLARAQADYDQAKPHFERISNLYSTQSATKPEYESARAQYEGASAGLNNAKAVLAEAQMAMSDSSLRAPFDGWIIRRNIEIGSLAGPTVPSFTIADTRLVRAIFGVPDSVIGRIKLGQPQAVTTDVFADIFHGRVTAISPAADPKSRVYSVEVTVPNPQNRLKAGMIASLSLSGEASSKKVLVVPLGAVIRDPQRANAFAVLLADGSGDSAAVHVRPVELGDAYGNMVEVLGGLKAGDRVVTSGATLVKDGDQVRIIP